MLKEIFCGEIVHEVCCQKCFTKTENKEDFLELHVNFGIPPKIKLIFFYLKTQKDIMKEVENLTLNDLLIKEFSPEEMKEKDKYFCNVCNDYIPLAIKQGYLSTLPNYLILTMNRFWFDFAAQKRNKIMTFVDIPLMLDLKPFTRKEEINSSYELYAILIHKVD